MPNLSLGRKMLNAALVLLIVSFLIEKLFSFPFLKVINEYLLSLVIPFITLIINNSEGTGESNININDGIQGNNAANNENANNLADEGNNEEAIPPESANPKNVNQLNKIYD